MRIPVLPALGFTFIAFAAAAAHASWSDSDVDTDAGAVDEARTDQAVQLARDTAGAANDIEGIDVTSPDAVDEFGVPLPPRLLRRQAKDALMDRVDTGEPLVGLEFRPSLQ